MSSSRPLALVTGASAGIGKELARVLAADGHDLVLSARRIEELNMLAQELKQSYDTACHVIPADLAEPSGPHQLFDAVSAAGLNINVLVNNAGFGDLGAFVEADLGKMLRMVQVNVTALTELTGLFVPVMRARGRGWILNVGSVAGFQPGPFMAVYYATKAYVNSFSEAIGSELRGTGVSVTCLCPGPTATEFAAVAGMNLDRLFSVGHQLSARAVAECGLRGLKRGKRVVMPGFRNRLLIFSERFAPRRAVVAVVRWMQEKRK